MRNIVSPLDGIRSPFGRRLGAAPFSPASLFAASEPGGWYDPSDLTTLFQDAAGTTPVTAVEQPVGLVLDKSKQQSFVVRRNRLNYTEDFANAAWLLGAAGVTVSSGTTYNGISLQKIVNAGTNANQYKYQTFTLATSTTYTLSAYASFGDAPYVVLFVTDGVANGLRKSFDVQTGTVGATQTIGSGWTLVGADMTPLGSGIYRLRVTVTNASSTRLDAGCHFAVDADNSTSSTISKFNNVGGFQLEVASSASEYQAITATLPAAWLGAHLSQSTAAARPVLSARVNLLVRTQEFDNAAWTKNSATVENTTAVSDPLGGTTADLMYPTSSGTGRYVNQAISGQTLIFPWRVSVSVRNAGKNFAYFYNLQGNGLFYVNLTTGEPSNVGANISDIVTTVGSDGWVRVAYTSIRSSGANPDIYFGVSDAAGSTSVTANGTDGIYIWGADLRVSNDGVGLPAYQRVGAATDYDTTGFPLFLRFDGTDDFLQSSTITPGAVDKAQVFAGVRRLPSATDYPTICEYSNEFDGAGNSGTFYLGFGAATQNAYGMGMKGSSAISYNPITYTPPITNVASMLMDIGGSSKADELKPYLNGVLEQEGGGGTNAGTGNFGSYPLYVGRRGGTTLPFSGHLYSLILRFSAANLDAATITSTETWVNGKTLAYGPPTEIEILTRSGDTILTRDGSTVIARAS